MAIPVAAQSVELPETPCPPNTKRRRVSQPHTATVHGSGERPRKSPRVDENDGTPASCRTKQTTLYSTSDGRGNVVPSSVFDRWLAALPDPIDPAQRYRDELRSYPTGTMRAAKPVPSPTDGAQHPPEQMAAIESPRSVSRPISSEWGWLPAVPLNHKRNSMPLFPSRGLPVHDEEPPQQQRPAKISAGPNRSPTKLQKKPPKHIEHLQQNQDEPSHAKQSRFGSFARSISRLSGRQTPAPLQDYPQDQRRPASALGHTLSMSRRRISGFFRPGTVTKTHQDGEATETSTTGATTRTNRRSLGLRNFGENMSGFETTVVPNHISVVDMLTGREYIVGNRPTTLHRNDLASGDYRMQIAFIGDATVGKTALIKRFVTGENLNEDYEPTASRDVYKILMTGCGDGVSCRVEIHDCGGGQEETDISFLTQSWWDAIVICYSIGDPDTLNACKRRWIYDARANTAGVPIFLAGLKSDRRGPALQLAFLQEEHILTRYHGEEVARAILADGYVECSAKDNKGVVDLFYAVVNASLPRVIRNERRAEASFSRKYDFLHEAGRKIRNFLHPTSGDDESSPCPGQELGSAAPTPVPGPKLD